MLARTGNKIGYYIHLNTRNCQTQNQCKKYSRYYCCFFLNWSVKAYLVNNVSLGLGHVIGKVLDQ